MCAHFTHPCTRSEWKLHIPQTFRSPEGPRPVTCVPPTLDGGFACRGRLADVRGGSTMPDVFDDELTDAELDQLEALGAAEDADLILGGVVGETDA